MWGWGIILRASQELGAALMVNKVILVKAEQESDFSIDKSKQKKNCTYFKNKQCGCVVLTPFLMVPELVFRKK